jgi:hypothetical protein
VESPQNRLRRIEAILTPGAFVISAAKPGPGSLVLAVQPQWSFPAEAWIAAAPEFWSASLGA